MSKVNLDSCQVVGISVRTSNQNRDAARHIPATWQKFIQENIMELIPHKSTHEIYAIYTNYEGDHNLPYDFILGSKVMEVQDLPSHLVSVTIAKSNYEKTTMKGDLTQGKVIFEAWQQIWESQMNRAYDADFEIYGAKSENMEDTEVDIYVSVK